MTAAHPIISITGSSGAGTTSVKRIFELIFRREKVSAAFIEGDAFHRFNRAEMKVKIAEEDAKGNPNFSHFNAEANELDRLASIFEEYGNTGMGRTRTYVHDDDEAAVFGVPQGTFSLDFPGSQGSHPGHSGILQGNPHAIDSGHAAASVDGERRVDQDRAFGATYQDAVAVRVLAVGRAREHRHVPAQGQIARGRVQRHVRWHVRRHAR